MRLLGGADAGYGALRGGPCTDAHRQFFNSVWKRTDV